MLADPESHKSYDRSMRRLAESASASGLIDCSDERENPKRLATFLNDQATVVLAPSRVKECHSLNSATGDVITLAESVLSACHGYRPPVCEL